MRDYRPPRELRPDLSPELERVVLRAMAHEPEARYATAAELADELEQLLSKEPQPPTGAHLAAYLRNSFGEERYTEKTRIPTLTTLQQAGHTESVTIPGSALMPSGSMPSVSSEARTRVVPPPSGTNGVMAGSQRWRGIVVGLVAGCLLLGGGAFVVGRKMAPPAPQPVVQVQAAPPSSPVPPPAVQEQPPAQVALAAAPESAEAPPAEQAEPPPSKAARAVKRVSLEAADIQRVVSRNRARIMSCFEQYKGELPADEGQVQVRFTIFSSGKADAATQGPLAERPVGKCLEKQVERLRFPAHRDKEVTGVLPFSYRVER